MTQTQARALHDGHPEAAGLRWWSTFESQWLNVTLFDRVPALRVRAVQRLTLQDDAVVHAAAFLGWETK